MGLFVFFVIRFSVLCSLVLGVDVDDDMDFYVLLWDLNIYWSNEINVVLFF